MAMPNFVWKVATQKNEKFFRRLVPRVKYHAARLEPENIENL
jgi:hypothetical protein